MITNKVLAGAQNLGPPIEGLGPPELAKPTGATAPATLAKIISGAIGLLTIIAVIYFLFNLLTGAVSMVSSGGDKGAFEDARRKLTQGIIGLIVTISAFFVFDLLANFLGIPTILDLTQITKF